MHTGVDALLSLGKGPEVPDGAVLFQEAVGFWLDDHNLRDYVSVVTDIQSSGGKEGSRVLAEIETTGVLRTS